MNGHDGPMVMHGWGSWEEDGTQPVEEVAVALLRAPDTPRLAGEDFAHTRLLAQVQTPLPPILVQRGTHRVIDGWHRVRAALLSGRRTVAVRYFDGSEHDAFALAVRLNVKHGLPLPRADRESAATRLIRSHPLWSDRVLADVTGLAPKTVAAIRRRAGVEAIDRRIGRDGRIRPMDSTAGRLAAERLLTDRPRASLREVAAEVGISPATVRDVRQRLQRGEPSVTRSRSAVHPVDAAGVVSAGAEKDLAEAVHGLLRDPSLRSTESGRSLLRWLLPRVSGLDGWRPALQKLPSHCTYVVAAMARRCADEWRDLAEHLETTAHNS